MTAKKTKKYAKNSETPSFELILQVRDLEGKPTGKTKSFSTDDPEELESFFVRNSVSEKQAKKQRPKKKESLSIIERILKKLEKNTKLPKGWDDKNGLPLNYNVYLMACRIIKSLEDLIGFMPRVLALGTGGAKLEFLNKKNEKELEITFFDEHTLEYFFYDPAHSFEEEKSIGLNELWKLRELFMLLNKE